MASYFKNHKKDPLDLLQTQNLEIDEHRNELKRKDGHYAGVQVHSYSNHTQIWSKRSCMIQLKKKSTQHSTRELIIMVWWDDFPSCFNEVVREQLQAM